MIPILDAGHGGMVGGAYQTAGKRSPAWGRGVLYEGAFNRWLANRVMEGMDRAGLPYYTTGFTLADTPLEDRVAAVNALCAGRDDLYLLSLHANAGGGSGMEIYTTVGSTRADALASLFAARVEMEAMPLRADYSDGDADREANFYILRHSRCPALLLEAGFMDSRRDYELLWDPKFLTLLAERVLGAIKYLYEHGDTL